MDGNIFFEAALTADSGIDAAAISIIYGIALAFLIIYFVAAIKLCRKIGIPVIVMFIPIYGSYVFYKAFGMKKWFWFMFISGYVVSTLSAVSEAFMSTSPLISLIAALITFVLSISVAVLAQR